VSLFANYNATDDLTFRINVGNVLDEEYWTAAYRSGSFMYLGDARNANLTATYEF
jgi:catecholate siderophore receptor